jgi:hypothetical protein
MVINFDLKDFDRLWSTGTEIKRNEPWFLESFPRWRFEYIKGRKTLTGLTWFYWIGESDLQALVAYKILVGNKYKVGLFWDTAPVNSNLNAQPWGYVIATNHNGESK